MSEDDYILATNVQKFRIICDLLQDCLPSPGLPEEVLNNLETRAWATRVNLFAAMGVGEPVEPTP